MNNSTFLQTLKELAEVQAALAKTNAVLAVRTGKEQVKQSVEKTKEKMTSMAQSFGVSLSKMQEEYLNENEGKNNILAEYQNVLENINEAYDIIIQEAMKKKQELEADEYENMRDEKETKSKLPEARKEQKAKEAELKDKITRATKQGNYDEAQRLLTELQEVSTNNEFNDLAEHKKECEVRREQLRNAIEESEAYLEDLLEERDNLIAMVTEERNTALIDNRKQNFFQRTIGSFLNKINGAKKFANSVITPLREQITTIKEETIPEVGKAVKEKAEAFSQKVSSTRDGIEKTAKTKAKEFKDKLANGKDSFVQSVEDITVAVGDKATDFKEKVAGKVDSVKKTVAGKAEQVKTGFKTAVTATVDFSKKTYRSVVNKGIETKKGILASMQQKIADKQVVLNEKQKILKGEEEKSR